MKQTKTIQLLGIIIAVLVISVGYAAITSVNLTLSGTATATPDQGNFKVAFTGNATFSGAGTAVLRKTGDLTATMDVSGLRKVGDTLTATFTITNTSTDITTYLENKIIHSNAEYFQVTSSLDSKELAPQTGKTQLHITVKLIKSPVTEDQKDKVIVQVTASPTPITGDLPEIPTTISFTINGMQYTVANGTTWGEWAQDNQGWEVTEQHRAIINEEGKAIMDESSDIIRESDTILARNYVLDYVGWGIS